MVGNQRCQLISSFVITAKCQVTKSKGLQKKLESEVKMEKSENFNHEREKNCANFIKPTVIRISSVSSKWKNRKFSKMDEDKNGVACTIARAIQINNAFSRRGQ